MKVKITIAVLAVALMAVGAGCGGSGSSQPSASQIAQKANDNLQSQVYQSKHNVEFRNYNLRQKIADDPATILWCTFFPQTTGQEPFTVPIAGKLTSSNKRPYQSNTFAYSDSGQPGVSGEVPGPDHMFGSSSEYRYGFDPTLQTYYDFTNLASFCTNEPTVWQANKTTIVVKTAATLQSINVAAKAAIEAGDAKKAASLLDKAETVQGQGK